jgi:hypothetical protein
MAAFGEELAGLRTSLNRPFDRSGPLVRSSSFARTLRLQSHTRLPLGSTSADARMLLMPQSEATLVVLWYTNVGLGADVVEESHLNLPPTKG